MLRYEYTTTGEKLSVTDGTTRTDYVGNLVYKNNIPDMILFDGGYIRNNIYYFYIRDRLGSVRAVADQNGNPVQSMEYYPYGLPALTSTGTSVQPYKYTGKELEETLGVERYDYTARRYDATTGRFMSMDPMAEEPYETSPYAYCYGNPIAYVDPFGTDVWSTSDPDQIRKFFDAYKSGANTFEVTARWQHISDNNFQAGLTMNDKGDYFYQYSTSDPDFTVHLLEFPRMRAQEDPNSHFEALTGAYSLYTQNEQKAFFDTGMSFTVPEILVPAWSALRSFAWLRRGEEMIEKVGNLAIRSDIVLTGGRSGQLVKTLEGPANSVLKGGKGRIFITDDAGKVIWDITKNRAKSVIPGQGFGPKIAPTQEQLNLLKQVWGN